MYKENPKLKGSGLLACIPQTGECPAKCDDCFFQSGRSYLEPLSENLPNMPYHLDATRRVVRVNDGNDSFCNVELVKRSTKFYDMKFYNTAFPLDNYNVYDAPFVLTVNPNVLTDKDFFRLIPPIPKHLMFVRVRTNTWNLIKVVDKVVAYYTNWGVPVVLTFMAYYKTTPPPEHSRHYEWRQRVTNDYKAITFGAWRSIMHRYELNRHVYSCGREGVASGCKYCGNCLREYFATLERLRPAPAN